MIDDLRVNKAARKIELIDEIKIQHIIDLITDRVKIVAPNNADKAKEDIRYFLDEWIKIARQEKNLYYYSYRGSKGYRMNKVHRLLKPYGTWGKHSYEKETLNSMRNVQKESELFLWED